jgi:hypothetical protein
MSLKQLAILPKQRQQQLSETLLRVSGPALLPDDVTIRVLCMLDVVSVARFGRVSTSCRVRAAG